MAKETFTLLIEDDDLEKVYFQKVPGEWVEIFPDLETFIWSDTDQDFYGLDPPFDVYLVVHGKSGVGIGRGLSREDAIESAKIYRESEVFEMAISEAIERYGLSPGFVDGTPTSVDVNDGATAVVVTDVEKV